MWARRQNTSEARRAPANVDYRPWANSPQCHTVGPVSHDELPERLGLTVRRVRQVRGYSQERLAELADLDRAYLSGLERGLRNPTLDTMTRLAKALEVPLHELVLEAEGLH